MANKTYNQYCAIAYTLDIVGERWTLLIVRNLLAGTKRFSDLSKGLPGISTNILTDRLKSLEAHGIITTEHLPPPAASTVYVLTPDGMALAGALGALAQWGATSLGAPQPTQTIVPESVIFMILGVFRRDGRPPSITIMVHVRDPLYDATFGVRLGEALPQVSEVALDSPDVIFTVTLEALLRLSSGQRTLQAALGDGDATLDGDAAAWPELIAWVDGDDG